MRSIIILLIAVGLLATQISSCVDNCKAISQPVCGVTFYEPYTLHSFPNQCRFDLFNCRNPFGKIHLILSANCPVSPAALPSSCAATVCPLQYKPVCAVLIRNLFSSRVFDNECEMQKHNCYNINNPYIVATSPNVCFI